MTVIKILKKKKISVIKILKRKIELSALLLGTCSFVLTRVIKILLKTIPLYFKYDPNTDKDSILFMHGYEPYFPIVVSLNQIFHENLNIHDYDHLMKFFKYPRTTQLLEYAAFFTFRGYNILDCLDLNNNLIVPLPEDHEFLDKSSSDVMDSYLKQEKFQEYMNCMVFQEHSILKQAFFKKAYTQRLFEESIKTHLSDIRKANGNENDSAYSDIGYYIYKNVKVKNKNTKKTSFFYMNYYDLKRFTHEELKYKTFYVNRFSRENGIFRLHMYRKLKEEKYMYLRFIKKFYPNWQKDLREKILKENMNKYRYYGKGKFSGKKW